MIDERHAHLTAERLLPGIIEHRFSPYGTLSRSLAGFRAPGQREAGTILLKGANLIQRPPFQGVDSTKSATGHSIYLLEWLVENSNSKFLNEE